jgi:mannose-1-phosphate guanylyltransferase
MRAVPSISVDYAVMEKSGRVSCVLCPRELGWSDLGSYDALYEELSSSVPGAAAAPGAVKGRAVTGSSVPGASANVALGSPEPLFTGAGGNLVSASGKRIVLVGVDDLVVVETADAILVARRGDTQRVKDAVELLKAEDPSLL